MKINPPPNKVPPSVLFWVAKLGPQEGVLYKGDSLFSTLITVIFLFGKGGRIICEQKNSELPRGAHCSRGGTLFGEDAVFRRGLPSP